MDIKLVKPKIHNEKLFQQRAHEIFESGCLTNNGPFLRQLEAEVSAYVGVPSLAVANATLGMVLVLKSMAGRNSADAHPEKQEVIIPSFTYWATAHAVHFAGMKPVFVDIDPETYTLDVRAVRETITPHTAAILAVHVFGNPCAIDELTQLAKEYNIPLLFDAAHAFGAIYKGKRIGQFGAAEIFSTHAVKTLQSAEGGIISTHNEGIFSWVQHARNFGMVSPEDTDIIGINAKMSELHAIVGLDSMEHIRETLSKKIQIAQSYTAFLQDVPGLRLQKTQKGAESSYFNVSILVDKDVFGMHRDELAVLLEGKGIQSRKYFYLPVHQHQSYKLQHPRPLPHTEAIAANILCLPNHTDLTGEEIRYVCEVIRSAAGKRAFASVSQLSAASPFAIPSSAASASSTSSTSPLSASPRSASSNTFPSDVSTIAGSPPATWNYPQPVYPELAATPSTSGRRNHANELFLKHAPRVHSVLITGGGGYIGCVLVKRLLEHGYQVRVLDQLIFGKEPLAEFVTHPHFDMEVGLVEDRYIVEKSLQGIDAVIHLAGLSNDPTCEINPELTRRSNIEATKVLLDLAKKQGVKRFLYASSCSIYGFTGGKTANEDSPLNPLTAYAKSKADCEQLVLSSASSSFTTTCLRKATVYGPSPRMRFDLVINTMTGMALSEEVITINGGEQWRPFVHVDDVADAYLFFLQASPEGINGQSFNIGSDQQNISITDLAYHIAALIHGVRIEQSPNPDSRSYLVSFAKVNARGWQAAHSIEDGVRGIQQLFAQGKIKNFRDLNYFNIRRIVTYLNI